MKSKCVIPILAGLATAAVLSFAPVASAGPGLNYWRRMDSVQKDTGLSEKTPPATTACKNPKVVEITDTKKDWPNGKGPLITTVLSTKTQCTSCGGETKVAKHAWLSGKGPEVRTTAPATHDCVSCGASAKS